MIPERPNFHNLVCLAPMAGYTDATFRALCREAGADVTFTEMVSAQALAYENARTQALLNLGPNEAAVVQLFGHKPEALAAGARRVFDLFEGRCLGVDINMGCPAPKITANGEGSALMRDPALAGRIVSAVVSAVPVPVSVKIRKGYDDAHPNAAEFARVLESSGASFLTVHGRTRAQQYAGLADRACIAEVKRAVSIPVIANGDVKSGDSALSMLSETNCDGVMVGRAALGNPFIFSEIRATLAGRAYTPPTFDEKRAMALKHAELAYEAKGDRGLVELRKHLPCYFTGFSGASRLRMQLQEARTLADIRAILT